MSKTATRRTASVPQDAWLDHLVEREGPTFKAAVDAEVAELHLEQDLVRLREREGLSQRDVARRLGGTQPVVARLEAGRGERLEVRTVVKHAAALGYQMRVTFVKRGPRSLKAARTTGRALKRA